jgi:hypothetical protein
MVRGMTRVAVLLAVLAVAACGGGDDEPDEDPAAFATTLVERLDRGQAGLAWDALHPRHQEAVSRAQYVSCERQDPIDGDVTRIRVEDVREEPWQVPGEEGDTDSTAVTLELTLTMPDAEPDTFDLIVHLFPVDGRWTWVIGPGDFGRYADGACPEAD